MSSLSKRLQSLADFISSDDQVVDVGCDHGLLSIYLKENNLCKKIIASDIKESALGNAISNIKKRNLDIATYLSDGINDVPLDGINTLIISGMGTGTILHILEDDKKLKRINKLVIQSNNELELLRRELNKRGFYLEKESVVLDKKKWYVTNLFIRSDKCNEEQVIKYGYLSNDDYNQYILDDYVMVYNKIPFYKFKLRLENFLKIKQYKRILKKHHK